MQRTYFLSVLIVFAIATSSIEANADCRDSSSSTSPADVSFSTLNHQVDDTIRAFELQKAKDAKSYCAENLKERFYNIHKSLFERQSIANPEDPAFYRVAEDILSTENGEGPWRYSLFPNSSFRLKTYKDANLPFLGMQTTFRPRSSEDLVEMERIFNGIELKKKTDPRAGSSDFTGRLANKVMKTAACAKISFFNTPECVSSVDTVVSWMTPSMEYGASAMTGIRWWRELYASNRYEMGIFKVAESIRKKITSSVIDKNDNIFDDLVSAFAEDKSFTHAQAETAAVFVLGAISSGGANTQSRTSRIDLSSSQLSQSLITIASALPYLDSLKEEKGWGMYSMPKTVHVTCDNAKSYHFWLSAALSMDLVENGHSPKAATAAAFIAEKGYQLTRSDWRRNGTSSLSSILTKDAYDPVSNIIRSDLAYSASGAVFGALLPKSDLARAKIDIDDTLRTLIKNAKVTPGLASSEARSLTQENPPIRAYSRWDDIFAPDKALEDLLRKNKDQMN